MFNSAIDQSPLHYAAYVMGNISMHMVQEHCAQPPSVPMVVFIHLFQLQGVTPKHMRFHAWNCFHVWNCFHAHVYMNTCSTSPPPFRQLHGDFNSRWTEQTLTSLTTSSYMISNNCYVRKGRNLSCCAFSLHILSSIHTVHEKNKLFINVKGRRLLKSSSAVRNHQ